MGTVGQEYGGEEGRFDSVSSFVLSTPLGQQQGRRSRKIG